MENCFIGAVTPDAYAQDIQNQRRRKTDVFDYIEMFYNPKRKHARNGMLSPADFERR